MKIKKRLQGFTVVELMIAVVLAGIIIPAIAIAITNLSVTNKLARDQALATTLIQNKVEILRSMGYNAVASGATTSFASELPSNMGSPKSASYTITTPTTGVKQIDLTITYTEYHNTRTNTYRTYISELGVGQ